MILIAAFLVEGCASSSPARALPTPTVANNWQALQQRPLKVPTLAPGKSCPIPAGQSVQEAFGPALGQGPAYAVGLGTEGILQYQLAPTPSTRKDSQADPWGGQKVLWIINPTYQGPVLIRGQQIDGSQPVRFNGGIDQNSLDGEWSKAPLLSELRIIGGAAYGTPWPNWPTYTRIRTPGCYAYQVDGTTFSEFIVFRAVPL